MLFFELFPAVFAIVALAAGIVLFALNRRAQREPESESPRTPSQPAIGPEAPPAGKSSSRPSMRA